MKRFYSFISASALFLILAASSHAALITINFDGVAENSNASNLYNSSGLTISSGIIFVSSAFGGSLNDAEYPPRSAEGVFLNDSNTTNFSFLTPIISFQAFITYGGPVTVNFYNSSDTLLSSILSGFNTNVATSGDAGSSANEQFSASGLAAATRVEVLISGADFTLDDLTFETREATGGPEVPEPATLGLAGAALAALLYKSRKSSR